MLNYTCTNRDTLRGKINIERRLRLKYNCTGPELKDKIKIECRHLLKYTCIGTLSETR